MFRVKCPKYLASRIWLACCMRIQCGFGLGGVRTWVSVHFLAAQWKSFDELNGFVAITKFYESFMGKTDNGAIVVWKTNPLPLIQDI